jgi:phosphonate transport system permease protein
MWPPRWSYLPTILNPLDRDDPHCNTGDAIGVVFSVPLAFLAARNTTANLHVVHRAAFPGGASRSVNTVIWGLRVRCHFRPRSCRRRSPLLRRDRSDFSPSSLPRPSRRPMQGQIEAVERHRRKYAADYLKAVLPQVMPVLIGTSVYRWDINVRESSVLGFVGAGGIGLHLYASINQLHRGSRCCSSLWPSAPS